MHPLEATKLNFSKIGSLNIEVPTQIPLQNFKTHQMTEWSYGKTLCRSLVIISVWPLFDLTSFFYLQSFLMMVALLLLLYENADCRVLPKNQYTQTKWLHFDNWCIKEVTKSAIIWPHFFFSEEWVPIYLGAHFLLSKFFDNINFQIPSLLKWCPMFDSSPLHQFSNSVISLWYVDF